MPGKLDEVVDKLIEGMHHISKIETVVGEPLQAGDAMLVPIHRLRVGFGVASVGVGGHVHSGEGTYGGRGVGGGVQIEPIAVVAVPKDGRPRLMAVDGESEQIFGQLFDQLPDLLGRVLALAGRGEKQEPQIESNKPAKKLTGAKEKKEE